MTALSVADDQLRAFVDRILRLKEEQDTISDDIKEVYAEAKGNGFDKTAMGALVSELRKQGKDAAKFEEANSILDLYRESYARTSHKRAPARTRENIEEFPLKRADGGADIATKHENLSIQPSPSTEPTPSQATAKADDAPSLAASSADNFEPPAFLRDRPKPVLRPHCLKPDNCGSYGAKHCGSCERAARESEAA